MTIPSIVLHFMVGLKYCDFIYHLWPSLRKQVLSAQLNTDIILPLECN